MKSALLAVSIATAALPAAADHLIVVKVGGTNFVAKVEDTATVTFEKATPSANIRMDGNSPQITAATNLPAGSAITTLAAKSPSAGESEWEDYNLLPADEKPAYRFFRLVANVD